MKSMLIGVSILSVTILMASGYALTYLQTKALGSKNNNSSSELIQIEKTIGQLKSEIEELERLQEKAQTFSDAAAKLDEKVQQYGSLETLQANLRVLNSMKTDVHIAKNKELMSSTSEKF
ncbi:MAG: hypothetical protein ACXWC9_01355 [Pseudobdellovibrionaceae bacterium]